MAFFKKVMQKISGLWYPRAVTVGKPVTTDQVADRLAQISTVSRADTYAVLKELGHVIGDYMAQGRTVKLDGVGTFYYTIKASGKGVDSPDKVSSAQIAGVRVQFIPEVSRSSKGSVALRTMVSDEIFWEEWRGKEDDSKASTTTPSTPSPGGGSTPPPSGGGSGSGFDGH